MDASELVKMSNYNIANFDLDGEVNKVADSLGTLSITTPDNTKIQVSIADIASGNLDPAVAEAYNKELTASIKDYAESIVGTTTDPSAASILADHMVVGKDGYKVTFKEMSEKERNEKNLIFFDPNGALVLTEQQQKDAVEFVEKKLRSSLDRKIQPDVLTKYQKENIRLREEELKFRKGDLAFRRKAQKEARDKAGVDENTYIPIDSRKNFVVNENSTAESAYNNVDRTVTEDNINDNPEALKLSVKNIFDDNSAFSNISMNDVEVGVEEITLKEKSTKGIGTGAPGFQDEIEVKEKVMSFHIPELMEEPLIVPMTENAQLFKDVLKSLDLYNQEFIKGNVKDKMKLTDFKDLFGVDKPFETYNKVQVDATKNVTTDPPLPTFPNTGTGSSTLNFG